MRYAFYVIASVGRLNDVYRPMKIQKSYRPTIFFNVIAAKVLNSSKFCHEFPIDLRTERSDNELSDSVKNFTN